MTSPAPPELVTDDDLGDWAVFDAWMTGSSPEDAFVQLYAMLRWENGAFVLSEPHMRVQVLERFRLWQSRQRGEKLTRESLRVIRGARSAQPKTSSTLIINIDLSGLKLPAK